MVDHDRRTCLAGLLGLALVVGLAGCPSDPPADDDATGDDDDTTAADDDDTTDGNGYEWPGVYQIVRICGSSGGDPADPGPDVDALMLRRDASVVGYATQVIAEQIQTDGNGHPDHAAALGEPDEAYVAVGGTGSWLDLMFDEPIEAGDLIVVFELTDGSGADETYTVMVSDDGIPGHWVEAETITGAFSAAVHPPEGPWDFVEGC